jgi:S-DNA-T family DNA segregation ATPase FtsK/SpoIIIE
MPQLQQPTSVPVARTQLGIIPCLLAGCCVFYYLALLTYHPYDNSFFTALVPAQPLRNLGGAVGAATASYGIYYFGLLAYLLPIPSVGAIIYLQRTQFSRLLITILLSLAGLCLFAIMLQSFHPYVAIYDLPFAAEGFAGNRLVAYAERCFGRWGSIVLSSTLLIAFLIPRGTFTALLQRCKEYAQYVYEELLQGLSGKLGSTSFRFFVSYRERVKYFWKSKKTKAAISPPQNFEACHHQISATENATIDSATEVLPQTVISTVLHSEAFAEIFPAAAAPSGHWGAEEEQRKVQLEEFFKQFKIVGKIVDVQRGPFVTTYAFKPEPGTKQNAIYNLAGDLALHLQVEGIFAHPLHSKSAIGLQIPNKSLGLVAFADLIQQGAFHQFSKPLPLALGVDVYGVPVYESLAEMPHLLLAGSTGSGKSVGLHSFICSLLSKTTPQELKLIFIDPKRLELTFYEGLPYLLRPIITEVPQALAALSWARQEMEQRYQILQSAKVRSIAGFNQWWHEISAGERRRFAAQHEGMEIAEMPYIVVVIDELADLVLQSSGEISKTITQLAQKARACGIHMILATQRPSVDVITGVIKANLPARISYRLTSSYDSRTILDQLGAEKLLGRGDMLWHKPGANHLQRLHGAFITDQEIKQLVGLLIARYT